MQARFVFVAMPHSEGDLDGDTVAVSSRSYLRVRECQYNVERFLEAVPLADVVAGTRTVRKAGRAEGGPARPGPAFQSGVRPAPLTARSAGDHGRLR